MEAEASSRRSPALLVLLLALATLAAAGFVALGAWQVERLAWKEALIARVERQLQAAPLPVPAPAQWPALAREQDEYRRLLVRGRFDYEREVLVGTSTALGSGYWVLTPLRTESGAWLLVNRGFVPPELRQQVPRGEPQQALPGLLRFSEPDGGVLRKNEPAQQRWYSRDVAAIAAARGLEGAVAPFFVDAQATPATADDWPRPGLTVLRFTNNHLVYALTWFTLAGIMVAAMVVLVLDHRRRCGATGANPLGDRHP